ncbi:MAG TPA: non-homologous end-joining DNA ligase [Candidatus Acidoferrales bacterium]|nr:non-homologous end-joining DNA ligase [Candidatus Acidoferrales bacterium]
MARKRSGQRNARQRGIRRRRAARKPSAQVAETPRPQTGSEIPAGIENVTFIIGQGEVKLTNLQKVFWPKLGLTKRDLLQYYLDVSDWLLPNLRNRAMVMKRYPNGIDGDFFFMKRAPTPRPSSIPICSIEHHSGNVIDFPVVEDVASLLWVVNLGCIDLNPWYARCDDVDRPDYLHFDLDPVPDASFALVRETALIVRDALAQIEVTSYAKTTGSRGIHVYVPIERGPTQKEVWAFAKAFAIELARNNPSLVTAEYRLAKRPRGRVLVDYNQNAWNRTLASVYSVRPKRLATVSAPVTWKEVEKGVNLEDFTMQTVPERLRRLGDLWQPLLTKRDRTDLAAVARK